MIDKQKDSWINKEVVKQNSKEGRQIAGRCITYDWYVTYIGTQSFINTLFRQILGLKEVKYMYRQRDSWIAMLENILVDREVIACRGTL